MKRERCIDGLFSDIQVVTTHKKKKGLWSIETAYIFAEGQSEEEALTNIVKELRFLAEELEALALNEKDKSR